MLKKLKSWINRENRKEVLQKVISCVKERRLPWEFKNRYEKIAYELHAIYRFFNRFFIFKLISMNKEKYLSYFDKAYQKKLNKAIYNRRNRKLVDRHIGFRKIFEELLNKKASNFTIVETGTLWQMDDWGAGQSSLLFYEFLNIFGGKLISIDLNEEHLRRCEKILRHEVPKSEKARLILVSGDSVEELNKINEEADLLYFDSYDLDPNNPKPSMVHHLRELVSARKIINKSKDLLIAIDDNFGEFGKGKYIIDWAKETDQEILLENLQVIIRIKHPLSKNLFA